MAGQLADAAGKFPEGLEQGIFIQDPERLTDARSSVLPAGGRIMKGKSGVSLAQDWIRQQGVSGTGGKKSGTFSEGIARKYEGVVQNYEENEEGEMEAEARQWDGLAAAFCVPWRFRDIRKYPVKR